MNVSESLRKGMEEAAAHSQGKLKLKTHKISIPDTKIFTADEVKGLRKELGFTQAAFADALGVSNRTVEEWESGKNTPCGSSSRLLEILQKIPDTLQRAGIYGF